MSLVPWVVSVMRLSVPGLLAVSTLLHALWLQPLGQRLWTQLCALEPGEGWFPAIHPCVRWGNLVVQCLVDFPQALHRSGEGGWAGAGLAFLASVTGGWSCWQGTR